MAASSSESHWLVSEEKKREKWRWRRVHSTFPREKVASVAVVSRNMKLAPADLTQVAAATYVPILSCSAACPLRDEGCYAQYGVMAVLVQQLDLNAVDAGVVSPQGLAQAEATEVRAKIPYAQRWTTEFPTRMTHAGPWGKAGYPIRFHVSGDCRESEAANILAKAAREWPGPSWSYTHSWNLFPRSAWGDVSVLASVPVKGMPLGEAVARARKAGYASARLVARHHTPRAFDEVRVQWIPCPAQTFEGSKFCTNCRLCWDADGLRKRRRGIAFEVHSGGKERAIVGEQEQQKRDFEAIERLIESHFAGR